MNSLQCVVTPEETQQLKRLRAEVEVSRDVAEYIMDIITATRSDASLGCGVSTRGGIALYQAAQATAALRGRGYVIPEDVRDLAPAVLAHRIGGGTTSKKDSEEYITRLLAAVRIPLEEV